MQGKVTLEDHMATEATLGDSKVFGERVWDKLGPRLIDVQDIRLREMDKCGIEMMILSLNAPAIQAIHDTKRAIAVAREANDVCAEHVRKRPDRFQCFAALPMQDPEAAAAELTRCVKELGFVGALVNGFSQIGTADNVALLRLAAIPGVLEDGRSARRAVLSASAQSAAELEPNSTKATAGCLGRTGPSPRKPPYMRCG